MNQKSNEAIRRLMSRMRGKVYEAKEEIRMVDWPWMKEGVTFQLLGVSAHEQIFRATIVGHDEPFDASFKAVRNLETRGEIEEVTI